MAFMGIFALSMFVMVFIIIIACVILSIFIPSLIIFIINLVKGIQNKWPTRNVAAVIITSIILGIIITVAVALTLFVVVVGEGSEAANASSSEAAIALHYLLSQIYH